MNECPVDPVVPGPAAARLLALWQAPAGAGARARVLFRVLPGHCCPGILQVLHGLLLGEVVERGEIPGSDVGFSFSTSPAADAVLSRDGGADLLVVAFVVPAIASEVFADDIAAHCQHGDADANGDDHHGDEHRVRRSGRSWGHRFQAVGRENAKAT